MTVFVVVDGYAMPIGLRYFRPEAVFLNPKQIIDDLLNEVQEPKIIQKSQGEERIASPANSPTATRKDLQRAIDRDGEVIIGWFDGDDCYFKSIIGFECQ